MDHSELNYQCVYANVRSLTKNYDQTEIMIKEMKPNLIFLSETRLVEEIENSEVNIKSYKLIRCDSNTRSTGGVAIYVKNTVKYEVISNECIVNNVWLIAIKTNNKRLKGTYVVLYKSHMANDNEFIAAFQSWCEEKLNYEESIYICGDFNINLLTKTCYSKKIK